MTAGAAAAAVDALVRAWDFVTCYNVVLFCVELMFCLRGMPRRAHFWLRLALVGGLYVVAFNVQVFPRGIAGTWLLVPDALLVFFCSVAVLRALFDASWSALFFYACASYAVEAIVHVMLRVERYVPAAASLGPVALCALELALVAVVLACVWRFLVRRYEGEDEPDVGNSQLLLFVGATLLATNVLSSWAKIEGVESAPFVVMGLLCYVLLLVLEFDVFRVSELERERSLMQGLFLERERQRRASQESVEEVNQRFHDLKHQIAALRSLPSEDVRERSLDELEQAIESYDDSVATGDAAIDAVLTEKRRSCRVRGIELTCIVDGACLARLGVVDACVLLGNALDNAIEAAEKIEDEGARNIALRAEGHGSFVSVRVENSCVGRTVLAEGGLPATTKRDGSPHGYGLKSIRSIAERHGGNMVIDAGEGVFVLSVLLPLP